MSCQRRGFTFYPAAVWFLVLISMRGRVYNDSFCSMKIKSIRGTQDILPAAAGLWQRIECTTRQLFELYGYSELRTPIFEETELFSRSIGSDTDIVRKEMYTFDQSKERTITLRPEGTAGVLRAYIEHGLHRQTPVNKLYYLGPMFRRERPQKGRYRQFHQIGAEVLGTDEPAVEGEVIEMLHRLMEQIGLSEFRLLINSVGCPQCRPGYVELLREEVHRHLEDFCSDCRRRAESNPLRVLDCKVSSCQPLIEQLPSILDHLCLNCQEHFRKLRVYLDLLQISYELAPRLVRGLDYYIRTTFEMVSEQLGPTQNAIVGGGRYDGLSEILGGPPAQGFGFALGMERLILLLLEQTRSSQSDRLPSPDIFLAHLGEPSLKESMRLAQELRALGVSVYIDFQERSVKAQMRLANRMQTRFTCVIGEDEIQSAQFRVKRMEDGQETLLQRDAIAEFLTSSKAELQP